VPENTVLLLLPFPFQAIYFHQGLSWRSFTLSAPLQCGIWLLRCLRPLSYALAFSRPETRVKQF